MSNPTPSNSPHRDPRVGLMFAMAHKLAPLFASSAVDIHLAWKMAVSAIEAYRPETRADYVNVARTIAFSMASVTLLGDAAAKTITMPEKMRLLGRANALDRSADQSERTMMQRQRYHRANPRPDHETRFYPDPKPEVSDADLDDAAAAAAVAEAVEACRAALAADTTSATPAQTAPASKPPGEPRPVPAGRTAQPAATTTKASVAAPAATATQATATQAAAAQAAAIRYNGPEAVTAQTRPVPHKQELLRHAAMQRVVDHIGPTQPGQNQPGQNQPGSFPPGQAPRWQADRPGNHTTTP